jgi:predicted ATPase
MAKQRLTSLPPPWLKRIWLDSTVEVDRTGYPFCLPLFQGSEFELIFDRPVTIIVGENGSGKSTLLEAIAVLAGFDVGGGNQGHRAVDHQSARAEDGDSLARAMRASWLPKVGRGWFFRAETFFTVARYLDDAGSRSADFLSHSHGEGFMRLFNERFTDQGVFIFDEPESALSPNRQFEFLDLIHRMNTQGRMQAIIATHSPILMALPGARLLQMDRHGLVPVRLEETAHYRIMREFILDPAGTVDAMISSADTDVD